MFYEDSNVRAGDGQQTLMNAFVRTAKGVVQALFLGGQASKDGGVSRDACGAAAVGS